MLVTIGICTWNRSGLLRQTLESIMQLRLPEGVTHEVIVCDNNSTDDTREVVESFSDRLAVKYVFVAKQGKSYALNELLNTAAGEWVLFLDDDVLVDEGILEAYLRGITAYPRAACFGGPLHPWLENPVSGHTAFLLAEYPYVYGDMEVPGDEPIQSSKRPAYGANMFIRADAMPAKGFDINRGMIGGKRVAGEDAAMIDAVLEKGHEGYLLHDAIVKHFNPHDRLGVRFFIRWQMGIGRTWVLSRGKATPGKFGVPWWAWKEFVRRAMIALVLWRPWPTKHYYDALKDAAQYLGYLLASR